MFRNFPKYIGMKPVNFYTTQDIGDVGDAFKNLLNDDFRNNI